MRPTIDEYLMGLAMLAATRTTCIRRGVGCVLADAGGHVLGIGYNGVARGLPHCNQEDPIPKFFEGERTEDWRKPLLQFPHVCIGHDLPPGQDFCEAVHAEVNGLLQCRDLSSIATAYVTLSPCKTCAKLFLNTPCQRIVFLEEHTLPEARNLWVLRAKREWILLSGSEYLDKLRKELSP